MSRPQKMHKPLKGDFNSILAVVAQGTGQAKRAANKAQENIVKASHYEPRVQNMVNEAVKPKKSDAVKKTK